MGNPIFNFCCCWSKRSNFFYNRNINLLISKLLLKSILDFRKWSNLKYENMYLHIFSLTTSRSPKLILKAVLKWEGPYFYRNFFWNVFINNKKGWKLISHCIFKSCGESYSSFQGHTSYYGRGGIQRVVDW